MKTVCNLCRRNRVCERRDATDQCKQFELAYLSASQLSSWRRCQVQWLGNHALRLNGTVSSAVVFGSATHKALAYNYRCALPFGRQASVSDVCEVFAAEFEAGTEGQEVEWKPDERPGKVKDEGVRCVKKYRLEVAPTLRPALVEEKFTARLAEPRISLVGWIDLADLAETVVEHKTSRRAPQQKAVDASPQLTAYALGYYVRRRKVPRALRMDTIVRTRKPKVVRLTTQRSDADLKRFVEQAGVVARQIEAAVRTGRYLANVEHPWCNPATCRSAALCGAKPKNGQQEG